MATEIGGSTLTMRNSGTSKTALDREAALSRMGGDEELLQEIALLFLSDSERMAKELERAATERDPNAINRAAHTIKGCVSNFGAQRLYEAALTLERMGKSGNLSNLDPAYQVLQSELAQLERDLRALTAAL